MPIDCSTLCAFWRFCTAVLYLSSRTDVCCSSWASVPSICATCDCVALICVWLGAGPESVVEVDEPVAAAPTAAPTDSHAPSSPAIMIARMTKSPPADSAPTVHCIHGAKRNGCVVAKSAPGSFRPVAA